MVAVRTPIIRSGDTPVLHLPARLKRTLRRLAPHSARPSPRALRISLQLHELEQRDCPSVWNDILVTNGSGSLRWAYEKATDTLDVDYENWARITIDDSVGGITLDSELIDGAIALTILQIVTETPGNTTMITGDDHDFRFINHTGNNGIEIYLRDLEFTEFGTSGNGGTINTAAPLTLIGCTFTGSEAGGNGGAIYSENSLTIEECEFTENVAEGDGGVIYCIPESTTADITLTGENSFVFNSAEGDGGAIYFYTSAGKLGIYDGTGFVFNFAGGSGGAIYMFGGGGGAIEVITDASDPESGDVFGFWFNESTDDAFDFFLTQLGAAHIDSQTIGGIDGNGISIHLYGLIPPTSNSYWSDINTSRTGAIDTNWPI